MRYKLQIQRDKLLDLLIDKVEKYFTDTNMYYSNSKLCIEKIMLIDEFELRQISKSTLIITAGKSSDVRVVFSSNKYSDYIMDDINILNEILEKIDLKYNKQVKNKLTNKEDLLLYFDKEVKKCKKHLKYSKNLNIEDCIAKDIYVYGDSILLNKVEELRDIVNAYINDK